MLSLTRSVPVKISRSSPPSPADGPPAGRAAAAAAAAAARRVLRPGADTVLSPLAAGNLSWQQPAPGAGQACQSSRLRGSPPGRALSWHAVTRIRRETQSRATDSARPATASLRLSPITARVTRDSEESRPKTGRRVSRPRRPGTQPEGPPPPATVTRGDGRRPSRSSRRPGTHGGCRGGASLSAGARGHRDHHRAVTEAAARVAAGPPALSACQPETQARTARVQVLPGALANSTGNSRRAAAAAAEPVAWSLDLERPAAAPHPGRPAGGQSYVCKKLENPFIDARPSLTDTDGYAMRKSFQEPFWKCKSI